MRKERCERGPQLARASESAIVRESGSAIVRERVCVRERKSLADGSKATFSQSRVRRRVKQNHATSFFLNFRNRVVLIFSVKNFSVKASKIQFKGKKIFGKRIQK